MTADPRRPAWVEVDRGALRHDVALLRSAAAPAELWAVVKADGYGHGAVEVATVALDAGCTRLCVALVQEAATLRSAGLRAPVVVLSEPPDAQLADAVTLGLEVVVYRASTIDRLASLGSPERPIPVHLKVDTGMHRVGCDPAAAAALAGRIAAAPGLVLAGTMTHLARADEPDEPANARQLARFDAALAALDAAGVDPGVVHAANSAALLALPGARRSACRAGIALYGIAPGPRVAPGALRPALSLKAEVAHVQRVHAGEGVSYGHRFVAAHDTTVVTVPLGYADGVPRRLAATGGAALVGGRRCPFAGVVTMDQLMLDVGDAAVAPGDEVVLLGRQGDEEVTATEWAERLGTIAYEVTCGLSSRLPRRYLGR